MQDRIPPMRWRELTEGEEALFELPMPDGHYLDFPYVLEWRTVDAVTGESLWLPVPLTP